MKAILIALVVLFVLPATIHAQQKSDVIGEAETNWPGIDYQIFAIERIPPDRLVVGIRVVATAKAPPQGTLLGTPVPIPPNADKFAIQAGIYHPLPLSFASSVMTDELTKQTYPALRPISPPGRKYIPSAVLSTLRPGGIAILTLQFAVPPPPPPPSPSAPGPVKQTLSFLFPNAKGPIVHVPIPPPIQASETAN